MSLLSNVAVALLITCGAGAVATACSSNEPQNASNGYAGSCKELASRCHGGGSDLAKECHELGHDGNDEKCGPKKNECLAACPDKPHEEPDGAIADAAVVDAAVDAEAPPDAECVTYCACMKTNCATADNYPFTDESTCFAACAVYTAAERACFQTFCSDAADGGGGDHVCDHASGKLGLAECP